MTLRSALLGGALVLAPAALAPAALAQSPAGVAPGWQLADATADGVVGVSLTRADALLAGRQTHPVVVAILDSGVDVTHPDLAPVLWTNPGEIAGNGLDDDGNGYIDDVHGWSFLGGPDGRNIEHETLEVTRLARACRDGLAPAPLDCDAIQEAFQAERAQYAQMAMFGGMLRGQIESADALLRKRFAATYDPADPGALDTKADREAGAARDRLVSYAEQGLTVASIGAILGEIDGRVEYSLNLDYDPRAIVGDDPTDLDERAYGNADVAGPNPSHGTGVAGLVAAVRGNGVGIDGIAPNTADAAPVRIMVVRTVPDGDERDKDVANAIRYAVDNGADVINMSFGKAYSPDRAAVDAAIRYAAEHDVLLVHASGNDGQDLETEASYPTPVGTDGVRAATFLEVGASAESRDELAASFSNYGRARVDLFAPGVQVTSLAPGGGVQTADGTSFASPIAAGVAALVLAYFPDLTAVRLRQLLLDSAVSYADAPTTRPGAEDRVRFGDLSSTGGVVNAAEAVRLAMERSGN